MHSLHFSTAKCFFVTNYTCFPNCYSLCVYDILTIHVFLYVYNNLLLSTCCISLSLSLIYASSLLVFLYFILLFCICIALRCEYVYSGNLLGNPWMKTLEIHVIFEIYLQLFQNNWILFIFFLFVVDRLLLLLTCGKHFSRITLTSQKHLSKNIFQNTRNWWQCRQKM